MITTTVGHINDAIPFFQKLVSLKLPAVLAFRVARLSEEIQKECDEIDKVRTNLMDKYFQKDENGQFLSDETSRSFKIIEGKEADYQKEVGDFLNEKVTLKSEKLPPAVLNDYDLVSPTDLVRLMDFFEE